MGIVIEEGTFKIFISTTIFCSNFYKQYYIFYTITSKVKIKKSQARLKKKNGNKTNNIFI